MFGKVKGDNVYTGTLKVCLNVEGYETNGDSKIISSVSEDGKVVGNTDVVEENAILIRIKDNVFVTLNDAINNGLIKSKRLNTFPSKDGELFVDKKTIVPYYSEINNDNSHVVLKKLVKKSNA